MSTMSQSAAAAACDVTFVLDNRERALSALLLAQAQPVALENLDLGDFQVRRKEDGAPILIVERKTVPDLVASLRDGRYREQKARLLASGCKAALVIEGGIEYSDVGGNKPIVGTVLNSALRDGVHVFVTQTPEETAGLLQAVMTRYAADAARYCSSPGSAAGAAATTALHDDYLSTRCIKSKRRDNIDGEACFLMQLCSVPGISYKKAQAIADTLEVRNMGALVRLLLRAPGRLEGVAGVGKQLAHGVREFLLGAEDAAEAEAAEARARADAKAAAKEAARQAKADAAAERKAAARASRKAAAPVVAMAD